MSLLILDSLEIRGFKAFRHLQIERLGRVNLIVGKNNVGKTALLEALHLYARRGSPALIWDLLEARDEGIRPSIRIGRQDQEQNLAVKYLFYGRKDITEHVEPFQIGPINLQDNTLSIVVGWYVSQKDEEGRSKLQPVQPEEYNLIDNPILGLVIQVGKQARTVYRLNRYFDSRPQQPSELTEIPCIFVSANGLSHSDIGQLWDNIALTDLQEVVYSSLRLIASRVEGVTLVDNPEFRRAELRRERIPIVKISELNEPIPLRSLGEGMNRMFGIVLALVNARNGLLLIDEIENGLHYSVQPDLWRLVFETASRLNVQVFAATHSWDCIKAFQQAAQGDKEEGVLISLRPKKGQEDEIVAVLADEEQLNIVTSEQIEVR